MDQKPSSFKSKSGILRVFNALHYSLDGFVVAWQQEAAFRQEILFCILIFGSTFFVNLHNYQYLVLIGSMVFLLILELINSAIESLADRLTIEFDVSIKRTKDMASAAVMLALLWVFTIWCTWIVLPLYSRLASLW